MRRHSFTLMLCLLLAAPCAWAAEPDTVDASRDHLDELKQQGDSLEAELGMLQKDLIASTSRRQEQEQQLLSMQTRLGDLEQDEKAKQLALKLNQDTLAKLIQSIVHLSRAPEHAVIAMSGSFSNAARTAKILGAASEEVHRRSENLKIQLAEMDALQKVIEHNRIALQRQKSAMEGDLKGLEAKITERSALRDRIYGDQEKEKKRLAELSRKAKNVQELTEMASLPPEPASEPGEATPPSTAKPRLRAFTSAKGKIRLPVTGKIISIFGELKSFSHSGKGIVVAAPDAARVVAPFDGEVVFTGPFMDYGRMIILRHNGEYHTLLAGLSRIDCSPGQAVMEGEPIGAMGGKGDKETQLYVEIRKDNRPFDPMTWFKGSK